MAAKNMSWAQAKLLSTDSTVLFPDEFLLLINTYYFYYYNSRKIKHPLAPFRRHLGKFMYTYI